MCNSASNLTFSEDPDEWFLRQSWGLTALEKEVVALYCYEGLSLQEVGLLLNSDCQDVEVAYCSAMEKLRELNNGHFDEHEECSKRRFNTCPCD